NSNQNRKTCIPVFISNIAVRRKSKNGYSSPNQKRLQHTGLTRKLSREVIGTISLKLPEKHGWTSDMFRISTFQQYLMRS
ncbi:MAG: hypothetical protein P1V19_25460, partial [Gimesia sp.]|nr:hypothetical protein [Gimesia sp.]